MAILPIIALLFYLGEWGVVGPAYFDGIIVGLAALYLVGGTRLKLFPLSDLEDEWKVLQPWNAVAAVLLLLAMFWPEVDNWSRSASMLVAGVIASTMAFMWRRDPWPWVPLIPLSVSAIFLVEAVDLPDDFLPLFLVALGFLGLGAGYLLRRIDRFAAPPFSWSIVLSAISLLLSFSMWDPSINSYSLPPLMVLLACQSILIYRAPARTFSPVLRVVAAAGQFNKGISPYRIHPHHIRIWGSGLLGTVALLLVPIGTSAILFSFRDQNAPPPIDAFVAVAWSIAALLISRYLLARVSSVHEWGGWIAGAVSAVIALAFAVDLAELYVHTVVGYGLVVLTLLYRIFTRWTAFSWLVTVFAGASIAMTANLIGLVPGGYWGPALGILALGYLAASVILGSRERDGYGPIAASVILMPIVLVGSLDTLDPEVTSVVFPIGAIYFAVLALVTGVDRALCRSCNVEYELLNRFCINCGKTLSGAGRWIPLSFIQGRAFPYLSSAFLVLSGSLLAGTTASLLTILDVTQDTHAYTLLAWATVFFVASWILKTRVSKIRLAAFQIVTGLLGASSVLVLVADGAGLPLTVTLYYVALLAMAFRLHFRNPLPLYSGSLLLAGAFLETLSYIDAGYLVNTIACSSLGIAAVVVGLMSERFSIRDSVPAYALGALAIAAGEWFAWGHNGAQIVVLGAIVALATCMARLGHRERSKGLTCAASAMTGMTADRGKEYVTTGLIGLATFTLPVWSIQVLSLFSKADENVGLLLAFHSALLFLIGGLLGRAQKTYALPLQAAGILTAIAGPLMALENEYYRAISLWIGAGAFGICLLLFRRWYWTYPVLVAAHLAIASSLSISGFDIDIHKKGLFLAIFALLITGGFGFAVMRLKDPTRRVVGGLDYRVIPLAVLASTDLTASLILAGWGDWGNWEGLLLSIVYTAGSVGAAHLTRSRYIPYASTFLLAVSVGFIAGMVGGGLSARAVGWAAQGLVLWWLGRGAERISKRKRLEWVSVWQQPLLNSGTRLSWFAVAFVAIAFWWGLTSNVDLSLSVHQATAVTAILGLLYLGMAVYHRRPTFGYVSAGALVVSWYLQLADRDIVHAQFYAVPAGVYLLALAFFETRRTEKASLLPAAVNVMGVAALVGSAFVQSLVDRPEWIYASIVGVEGVLLALWGAASKSKVPFIAGIIAFSVNVLYQSTSILSSLNAAAVALGMGLVLVALAILLERFRGRVINAGRRWSARLQNWNW